MVELRDMKSNDIEVVRGLVKSVFDEFIAPTYSRIGCDEFYKYITPEAFQERLNEGSISIIAMDNCSPIGVIEVCGRDHVSLLFVDGEFQRKGIARRLLTAAIKRLGGDNGNTRLTVNASPNAVNAYRSMGFVADGGERAVNGIRFIPMVLVC